ncbi:MAG: prolipoprotein diacylglyceryl transferase [Dehalococcoidia bacterium]|nr:prolipoprotein diacylglyceryl transferase [Dehalococcoidia bacterium]
MLINIGFDPILAQLGSFQLAWHGILTALAIVIAVLYGERRLARAGLSPEAMGTVVFWAIIGGLIGARLFHVADHLEYYLAHPVQALSFWEGGLAVYGAFFGGIVAAIIAVLRAKFPIWRLLDAGGPALLVGQAIGRVGCFMNGDAWGAPTGAGWGVVYTHPLDLLPSNLLGVPTHPYPLYEIAAVMVWFGVLWLVRDRLTSRGSTFLVAMMGYAVIRFGLTYFRQETLLFWGLQEAQVIALVTGIACLIALVALRLVGGVTGSTEESPAG